jgi:hypothetical protein
VSQGKARVCKFPGCGLPVHSRGLCRGHSGHVDRGQELRPLRDKRPKGGDPLDWAGRLFIVTAEHPTCWTWHRASGSGRGYISVDGQDVGITRFMWSRLVGPVPEDHDADHLCSNVLCANVVHLQVIPKPDHREVTVSRRRELKHRQELEPDADLVWTPTDRPLPTSEALGFAVRHGLPFWMLGEWRNLGGIPSAQVNPMGVSG